MRDGTYTPRVLTVGAYDMDSLGDFLLLLLTEQYLSNARIVTAAPFSWDVRALLGREVHAYGPLLEAEKFDVIWTVGGGLEDLDLADAFSMSAPPEVYRVYERVSPAERERMLRRAVGSTPIIHPYIPSPMAYPLNTSSITVLNSVGFAHILSSMSRRDELISLLRGTTFISVRDKESSDLLESLDIEHRLAPDTVHAIGLHHPAERNAESDVAIIQIFSDLLSKLGPTNVANALVKSQHLRGLRIRVLMTGIRRGCDSVEEKEGLIKCIRRAAPATDVELIDDRHPFDLVNHIRDARVVVGASLHVRVVACSYKVPRVTLSLLPVDQKYTKTTRYARLWDPVMPYDVSLNDLDQALARAFSNADRPEVAERSEKLARLAHDNLEFLASRVMELVTTQTFEDKTRRLTARQERS